MTVAIYKDQLAELDRDVASGHHRQAEAEAAAHRNFAARLLQAATQRRPAAANGIAHHGPWLCPGTRRAHRGIADLCQGRAPVMPDVPLAERLATCRTSGKICAAMIYKVEAPPGAQAR